MGLELEYIYGQTPINQEEKEGLLIPSITTKRELNELEHLNIEQAVRWSLRNSFDIEELFCEPFIKQTHKKMFGDVWSWAGEFRKSEKNLGVPWHQIGIQLRKLLDDSKYWIEQGVFSSDETAIQFKHRLVKIHCFPNGNGRHSRLMADIIIENVFHKEVFSWGHNTLNKPGETRKKYIDSIIAADLGDIQPLLEFSRS